MIRFNIIGTGFLDLQEGSGIAFKTENQQFRFADISLGRSVEFTVPATDYNRRMLGFAEDPAEYGEFARRSIDCQMVYDGGAMMGTINITGYENKAFKCVFVMNGAEWLNDLQNKKLSECVTSFDKGILWSSQTAVVDADQADPAQGMQILRYENGLNVQTNQWQLLPAVNVSAYIADILANMGVSFTSSLDKKYWLVAGTIHGTGAEQITFTQTTANNISVTGSYFSPVTIDIEWATARVFGIYMGGGSTSVKAFKALDDVEIKLGNVPSGTFLIRWSSRLNQCECLGGYDGSEGTDISNTTVSLKKGQIIFFAARSGWIIKYDMILYGGGYFGWKDTQHPITINASVAKSADLTIGEVWYLQFNHPDMTVFEFLKSVARATGMELFVDSNGIVLRYGSYGGKTFKELRNVMSIDSVYRCVEAWGRGTRKARIVFDSDDYVTEKIISSFEIDNDQNTDVKDSKVSFSEGSVGTNGVLIKDVIVDGSNFKFNAKRWTITQATDQSIYLQRVEQFDPIGYGDITANATCVHVKVAAGEADFFSLEPSTTFIWRGIAYVWTDANWSNGVLSMTLQKVSQEGYQISV